MDEPTPPFWQIFFEVYEALPRQGPGNRACALACVPARSPDHARLAVRRVQLVAWADTARKGR